MKTTIVEYSATAAALAELADRYQLVVYDVTTPSGMTQAKAARSELRTLRTDLEKMRVSIKAPALERCRLIDAEAKEITAQLFALEDPIAAQISHEENKAKEAAMAKAIAERKAAEAAEQAIKDAELAKMAAQQAEIDRQKAELAVAQAAAQKLIDDATRASKEAMEAAERESRLKIEEQERAARQAQEAEAAKVRAEQDAAEAKAKAERNLIEAAEREAKRQENLRLDGKEMLKAFVSQFGAIDEFKLVVSSIQKFLKG